MNPARSFARIVMEGAQHMLHNSRKRWLSGVAIVAIGAIALTACASEREDGGGNDESSDVDSTFVFGASNDPSGLDPAFASDGETFRVSRQIFEGLVGVEAGTADPAPLLAESWEQSEDGLSYTFTLKEGVTFHDGTEFNAEAVCANFERWYNWTGLAQSESLSYYYGSLFKGFADTPDTAVYDSCTADDASHATVTLTQPFAGFIAALSLPAFSMQSPTALAEYDADGVGGSEEAPTLSEYANEHPIGHRTLHVRLVAARRAGHASGQPRLLGRAGPGAGDHLPGDHRSDCAPSGSGSQATSTATTWSRPPTPHSWKRPATT